ncbi:MAG TPA: hypothetical protein VKA65_00145 [Acidimicrobiales bacterium]|nr:hypothetical protein [Acidimicrobiales bacterium]
MADTVRAGTPAIDDDAFATHRRTADDGAGRGTPDRTQEAGGEAPTGRDLRREAVPLWLVSVVVYALTLSSVPALTHDSLTYLQAIEDRGQALWHPHHLLYNAIGAGWLGLVRTFGYFADPIKIVAVANSFFGATAVLFCYLLLRQRARLPTRLALVGAAGAGLSFGVWFYSASVEVYVFPLAVLLATVYVLLAPRLTDRHVLLAGFLTGFGVLGHQVHALFGIVVVAVLWARRHEAPAGTAPGHSGRPRGAGAFWRWSVRWAAMGAAVVAAGYGLVITLVVRPANAEELSSWVTRYADDGGYWVVPGASTVPSALFGAARAVVGGHFLFRLDWVRDTLEDAFPSRSLNDEAFLVRQLAPSAAVAFTAAAVVGTALLVTVLVRGIRRRRQLPAPARMLVRALVVWIGVYTLFFLLWEPSNLEFWIPQVTCLWLVTAALSAPREASTATTASADAVPAEAVASDAVPADEDGRARRWATVLGAGALLIGVANLAGSIMPAIDAANDVYAVRYRGLGMLVGEGDAVVVDRPHLSVGYARRHSGATSIAAVPYSSSVGAAEDPADGYSLDGILDQVADVLASGHRVAVDVNLLSEPASDQAHDVAVALSFTYGGRWRTVEPIPGVRWLIIDPPPVVDPPP